MTGRVFLATLLCVPLACASIDRELEALERRATVATQQADWPRAAGLWYELWASGGGTDARAGREAAGALLESGDALGALALLVAIRARLGDDGSLAELTGRAHAALDRREAALADYARACELEPERASAWRLRGRAAVDLGLPGEGADALARALAFEPDDGELALDLARAAEAVGARERSLAAYRQAFARGAGGARERVRAACLATGPEGTGSAEALDWLADAAALDPQSVEAHYLLGKWSAAAGRGEAARTNLERAVELEPTHLDALRELEQTLLASGDTERAAAIRSRIESLR